MLRIAAGLGGVAVPLCLRELAGGDDGRGRWAYELLGHLATAAGDGPAESEAARERVLRGLRELTGSPDSPDTAKVRASALLSDLDGEPAPVDLADPEAASERSLHQLAAYLTSPAEVASAADMLIEQLDPIDLLDLVEGMASTEPARARILLEELLVRGDLDDRVASELRRIRAPLRALPVRATAPGDDADDDLGAPISLAAVADAARPVSVRLGTSADGRRSVLVAVQRLSGSRPVRQRALCCLVDESGYLAEAMHRNDYATGGVEREVIAPLVAQGYRFARTSTVAARRMLVDVAARTWARGHVLPRGFYLGRDLLAISSEHLGGARLESPAFDLASLLGRGIDLLAVGDAAKALPLLERYLEERPDDPDAVSSLGLCHLALGDPATARAPLDRAAALEPARPFHHWNRAAAAHRERRLGACYLALLDYLRCATTDTVESRSPRCALARRYVADYERAERLFGQAEK
jgi:tetratricopeptide (TPR) repeat protein